MTLSATHIWPGIPLGIQQLRSDVIAVETLVMYRRANDESSAEMRKRCWHLGRVDFGFCILQISTKPDSVALGGQQLVRVEHLAERAAAIQPLVVDACQHTIFAGHMGDDEVLLAVAHVGVGLGQRIWLSRTERGKREQSKMGPSWTLFVRRPTFDP